MSIKGSLIKDSDFKPFLEWLARSDYTLTRITYGRYSENQVLIWGYEVEFHKKEFAAQRAEP